MDGLLESINKMRTHEDMCDVTVVTKEGNKHSVHSLILAGASPVFKVMVTKEFKELHSKVKIVHPQIQRRSNVFISDIIIQSFRKRTVSLDKF